MEIGGGGGGFTKAKKMFKESIKLNRIYLGGGGGGEEMAFRKTSILQGKGARYSL